MKLETDTPPHSMDRLPGCEFSPVPFPGALLLLGCIGFFLMAGPRSLRAQTAFLDFSVPAREAALGGNGVAFPEGTASLIFNPAGLGDQSRFEVSARYEDLFPGIGGDDLSTGNVSAVFPLQTGDAVGLSVDHFGAANLEQDRLLAAFGKSFQADSPLSNLRLGVGLSYLREQFTLSTPLSGVNPGGLSSGAFSVGAGALYEPLPWAALGLSVDDLNQPNLGVLGPEPIPILLRYGAAVRVHLNEDRLLFTLAQSLTNGVLDTQAGAEWSFTRFGAAIRVGGDADTGSVGLGWRTTGFTIDYAYQFSWNQAPSIGGVGLPGSHLLEVAFNWENTSRDRKVFDGLLFQGDAAMKAGQWKEAFWYLQQAYLLDPNDPAVLQKRQKALEQYNFQRADAYYKEGRMAENQGYFLEAQRDYEWASNLKPGEAAYSQARDRVKKALTQGALSDPRVQKLLERSVALIKAGDKQEAGQKIKEAQALYPDDAFLDFVARAYSSRGYAGSSRKDVSLERMAVEAEIYRSKGRLDLAKQTWEQMLKLDPANAMARENLAEGERASSVTLSPAEKTSIQALLQRALKSYVNGDVDTAVRYWEDVLKIDPQNVNALNNLTRVKMDQGGNPK